MTEQDALATRFEEQRPQLRAVAYRMLGSVGEADDAVQEAWLRLARSGSAGIDNLGGWLTTVVGRVCLDMLRSRRSRREEPLDVRVPDPVVTDTGPEQEAVLGDAVGLALLVVLETLAPAERLAFVLHDMFGVPYEQIGPMVDRSPETAMQLASRARRRVRGAAVEPDADLARQREVVAAFQAAARTGDFDRLLALLDPDITLRVDWGPDRPAELVRGAATVAARARLYSQGVPAAAVRDVVVNGGPALLSVADGRPQVLLIPTVRGGRIVEIDIIADPDRLFRIGLTTD